MNGYLNRDLNRLQIIRLRWEMQQKTPTDPKIDWDHCKTLESYNNHSSIFTLHKIEQG